jgi:hypothetical protein
MAATPVLRGGRRDAALLPLVALAAAGCVAGAGPAEADRPRVFDPCREPPGEPFDCGGEVAADLDHDAAVVLCDERERWLCMPVAAGGYKVFSVHIPRGRNEVLIRRNSMTDYPFVTCEERGRSRIARLDAEVELRVEPGRAGGSRARLRVPRDGRWCAAASRVLAVLRDRAPPAPQAADPDDPRP